jgi:hypothetical protein
MLIAEEFLLLALDDVSGRSKVSIQTLEPALGGALLAELALLERVGVSPHTAGWRERGRITLTSAVPTDDPELDRVLDELSVRKGTRVKDLISPVSTRRITKGVLNRLLTRLAAEGVLTADRGTLLGVIPTTRWHPSDPEPEEELRGRLQSALVGGAVPTGRTVALIGLLEATSLLPKVVLADNVRALRRRAKELAEGDWAADAVRDAIEQVGSVVAVTVVAAGKG